MVSARIAGSLFLLALLACVTPVAASAAQTAGFEGVNVTATADADADGHISAGVLTIDLGTNCAACSQSAGSLTNAGGGVVVKVNTTAGGAVWLRPSQPTNETIHLNLVKIVDFTETERTNVTVTLYDDSTDESEPLASETITVNVESPAADHAPNRTDAEPMTGLPAAGTSRATDHFRFAYNRTQPCGLLCRDATGQITTTDNTTAENVSVRVRLRSGRSIIWSGSEPVGVLTAGDTYTSTQRINLGTHALNTISQNDGRVALVVEIRSDKWHEVITFGRQLGI